MVLHIEFVVPFLNKAEHNTKEPRVYQKVDLNKFVLLFGQLFLFET